MKHALPLCWLAALALGAGCRNIEEPVSKTLANGNATGEFKGFVAIDTYVSGRLVAPAPASTSFGGFGSLNAFSLSRYLQGGGFNDGGLKDLLGVYVQVNGATIFKNGTPNALNMALWQTVCRGFAHDLAQVCAPGGLQGMGFTLRDVLASKLLPLCKWPAATAKDEQVMLNVWMAVMGFQAPKSEFVAWRQWFVETQAPAYDTAANTEVLTAMLEAAMMNPYFLLSQ